MVSALHVHLVFVTKHRRKMLNAEHTPVLRKHYTVRTHRDHLWSPSYFAASCGGAPISVLRQCIENQQTPA